MNNSTVGTKISFEFEEEESTIWMEIDGKSAGSLVLDEMSCGDALIGNVDINEEYQGKGLYKQLIASVFSLSEVESLRSNNRNENSNPCWEKWTGRELEFDEPCFCDMESHGVVFSVED